ncbi:MAG: hypothetical protein WC446_02455 [Candidatus Paceibacterota bacterium]|jgi:uncharacterized protein YpmB
MHKYQKGLSFIVIIILVIIILLIAGVISYFLLNVHQQNQKDSPIIIKNEKAFIYNSNIKKFEQISPDGYKVLYYGDAYSPSNNIFVLKDNKIFKFNIISLAINETSLPVLRNETNVYESINDIVLSLDKTKAIIAIAVYDKNSKEYQNELGGPKPISTREIEYDIQSDKWKNSNFSEIVKNILKEDIVSFSVWDSQNNKVFGRYSGKSTGYAISEYIVDLNENSFKKTSGYPDEGVFSFNLGKLALIDDKKLILFDLSDLSNPQKTIDIKNILDSDYEWVDSMAWSPDDKQIAIGTSTKIHTVDIESGNILLRFSDETINSGYTYWDKYKLTYSLGGRYILFDDFDNTHQEDTLIKQENNIDRLTSIDVNTNTLSVLQDFIGGFSILMGGY